MDTNKLWSGYNPNTYKQNPRCLSVNTILAGKYLVGPVLGQGGFGITYIGYDLNMETYIAIKEYFPVELVSRDTTTMHGDRVLSLSGEKSVTYQQGLKKYVAEAQSVSQFSDVPGVVSVKDFFYENETAYIVMEYIEGQSLKDYLKEQGGNLPEEETLRIMKPVLEALVKVHAAGIIHRDISPDNIMLTFEDKNTSHNGDSTASSRPIKDVKLIDFGAARMTAKNDQKSLTIILKHGYAPEEQYRTHGEQGSWTDVYAICSVMYRMLTGVTPVPAMDRLFKDELKSFGELGIKISQNTADAILKGLAVKKDDRIQNMQELIAVLYEGKKLKKTKAIFAIPAAVIIVLIIAGVFLSKSFTNNENLSESSNPAASDEISNSLPDDGAVIEEETLTTEAAEEEFGEVIVTATPQTSYDGSVSHVVILLEDGTVTSLGSNQYGQRNLSEWKRIAAVAAGDTFSAGLREDGKVLVEGELTGKEDVERWTNIIAISAADRHLYGLTADGTIVCNQVNKANEAFTEWTDIKSISAAPYTFSALTNDGQVFSTGLSNHTPSEISGWTDVKFIDCSQRNVFGVKEDGTVIHSYMWSDYELKSARNKIETFQNIVQLYVDHQSFYGVSEDGTLYIGGEKYSYTESQDDILQEMGSWNNLAGIVGTAMGEGRIAAVQKDGTILKTSSNYGNTGVEDMQNLEKIKIFNGDDAPVVSGITKNHQLLYYSFLNRSFTESTSIKDLMQLDYYDEEDSLSIGYAYLDTNGDLFMENPYEVGNTFHSVDSSLIQVSCVAEINSHNVYVAGLKEDGTIRLYQPGYYEVPEALHEAEDWTDISQIALCESRIMDQSCLLALENDGTILALKSDGTVPEAVSGWTDIVSLHEGTYAIGAIRSDGTAVFMEDDPEYNYGQYNTSGWTDLTQLALGLYHTAGLRSDGTVYATGRNDAGQCEVENWTDIVYITAGESCTLGIREDGTLVVAGDVGW